MSELVAGVPRVRPFIKVSLTMSQLLLSTVAKGTFVNPLIVVPAGKQTCLSSPAQTDSTNT